MAVFRRTTAEQKRRQSQQKEADLRRQALSLAEQGFIKSSLRKSTREADRAFDDLFDNSKQGFYNGKDITTGRIKIIPRTGGEVLAKGESAFGTSQGTTVQFATVRRSGLNFTDFR